MTLFPLNSFLVPIRQPEAHLNFFFPHYLSAKVNYKLFQVGVALEAKKKEDAQKILRIK